MATGTPSAPAQLAVIRPFCGRYLSTAGDSALTWCHLRHGITREPCWRSCTVLECHGPPQDRAGAQGAQRAPSDGEKGEPAPVTHDHRGRIQGVLQNADTVFFRSRGGAPGPEVATLVQGRFKRDGSASAE